MTRTILFLILPAVLLVVAQAACTRANAYPPSRRDDVKETLHGVTIADPYRWLEDQNSPATRSWIQAQNAYTRSALDRWAGRAALEKRMTGVAPRGANRNAP